MTNPRRRSLSRRHRVAGSGIGFIRFQTECTAGDTFDPAVTLHTGCPYTAVWTTGDGHTEETNSLSYTGYTDAGPHTVTLYLPDIGRWLKTISVYDEKITGDFLGALQPCHALQVITAGENTNLASDLASIAHLTNLTELYLQEHQTGLVGDIANLANLTALEKLYCAGCGLTGDIASLTGLANLWHLDLHSHNAITGELSDLATMTALKVIILGNTAITGALSDLATLTALQVLYLYNNVGYSGDLADLATMPDLAQVQLSGCSGYSGVFDAANVALWWVNLTGNAWNQAAVDAFLAQMYATRANYTGATHYLYIGGTNAEPGGTYQDGDPPTTGKEYIYELCNDPESEAFPTWEITYTASGANVTKP